MDITEGWIVNELGGEYVVVPIGENANDFRGIVKLNETGLEIWNGLVEGLSAEDIADKMTNEYENLTYEKALADVGKVITELQKEGLLER